MPASLKLTHIHNVEAEAALDFYGPMCVRVCVDKSENEKTHL